MSHSPQLTRRAFLRVAALSALAPAGCATPSTVSTGHDIDAHVHVWTPDTVRYPLAHGFTRRDMVPPSFTPEQLFTHMRPNGVSRVVLIQMNFYGTDNRYLLDCLKTYPRVFRGVAVIDENAPDLPARMRDLRRQSIRGYRLYADHQHTAAWHASPAMHTMWQTGAETRQAMCLLADPESLPAIERMCQRHPETPVVIDHFARIGMKGPVRPRDLDRLCALAKYPHTHVKVSAFYALGAKRPPYTDLAPMIQRLRDTFGAHRLMWGSDCPYQVQDGHTYAASHDLLRTRLAFLTPDDRAWMLRRTAEKVFFA